MLDLVKLALRITTTDFDAELTMLINDCLSEMGGLVVDVTDTTDAQIQSAVVAYCKWKFGNNEDSERWEAIYHEKLGQLMTRTGYTTWS